MWSLALRRSRRVDDTVPRELTELIQDGRVAIIGAVRQELLSGVKSTQQFEQLRDHLRAFPDLELESADYEEAASYFNQCQARGIQGSNTDFLICAAAVRRELSIFTTDKDFKHFARVLRLALHEL